MKIVIDVPENHELISTLELGDIFRKAIKNTAPLPKGHGNLKDIDEFIKRVEEDRMHECYMRSWTIDDVLQKLDSWYAPIVIKADKESEVKG